MRDRTFCGQGQWIRHVVDMWWVSFPEFVMAWIGCVVFFRVRRSISCRFVSVVYRYEMMAGAAFGDISVRCYDSSVNCIQKVLGDV